MSEDERKGYRKKLTRASFAVLTMTKSVDHLDLAGGSAHGALKASNHRSLQLSGHTPLHRSEHYPLKFSDHVPLRKSSSHGPFQLSNHPRADTTKLSEADDISSDSGSSGFMSFIQIDHPFHLKHDLKFAFTYSDDSVSIGSSVCSGLRNSLDSPLTPLTYGDYDSYSDIDSFSEASSSEASSCIDAREFPSWRLKPSKSKSDWTMSIESVPGGRITKYHVHKKLLSRNGKKHSDFFSRMFSDSSIKKKRPIKIHEDAASLIGNMLDYLYSSDDRLVVNSETAVGLRHLSQFFGIRSLAKRVGSFILDDICMENMNIYMETTAAFDDFQTTKLCADRCAAEIGDMHPLSPLIAEMDPSFILSIVSSEDFDRERHSDHMSHIMTGYFISQRGSIDGGVFEELTSEEYLPSIDLEAALPLLILEAALVEDSTDESTPLSSLQERCVEGILPLFRKTVDRDVSEEERKSRETAMLKVPKKVLVQILSTISAE